MDFLSIFLVERLICIIWMSFGAGFYSYSIGSLSSVITNLDTRFLILYNFFVLKQFFLKESQIEEKKNYYG